MKKLYFGLALTAMLALPVVAMSTPVPMPISDSTGYFQTEGNGAVGLYTGDGAWFDIAVSLQDMNNADNTAQLFGFDATPGSFNLLSMNEYSFLETGFVLRFDVDSDKNGISDYSLYSDATLNHMADGTSVDYGVQHVFTSLYGNTLSIGLEDVLSFNNPDWDGNDWEGILVSVGGTINEITGPNVAPVPEPATMLLFGTGLIGLAGSRLRKKKK